MAMSWARKTRRKVVEHAMMTRDRKKNCIRGENPGKKDTRDEIGKRIKMIPFEKR
jgi:hypothetical protein